MCCTPCIQACGQASRQASKRVSVPSPFKLRLFVAVFAFEFHAVLVLHTDRVTTSDRCCCYFDD